MSHFVSYWWIRKTQVIPEYVVFYKNRVGCGGCEEEQSFWKLYIQMVFGTNFMLYLRKLHSCMIRSVSGVISFGIASNSQSE